MKKIFKNKKMTTGAIVLMTGVTILLAGLTLAWFASSGSTATNTITMGTLDITAELGNYHIDNAEPGMDYFNQIGKVQSLGSIPALVKLSLNTDITMSNGAAGDPSLVTNELQLDGTDGRFVDSGMGYDIKAHELGMWFDFDNNNIYMWGELDGDIYLAIQGPDALHFAYTIDTDGKNMGNDYQGASIDVSVEWEATQLLSDGAIEDIFGIFIGDIDWYPGFVDAGELGFVSFSMPIGGSSASKAAQVLASVIEDLPDCGYKSLLEDMLAAA